jgi:Tol biopolymer transport system component
MKRTNLLLALLFLTALNLAAQTQIQTTIDPSKAIQIARIAIPRPETTLPLETINTPFFAPLTRDLAYSGVFAIAPIPPNIPAGADLAQVSGAQFVLSLKIVQEGQDYVVDARLLDSKGGTQFGQRYRGGAAALPRMAHMLGNDLVRTVIGKSGIFLSSIGFASDRTHNFEIWLMDWDGTNQRQITHHNALSILPSW